MEQRGGRPLLLPVPLHLPPEGRLDALLGAIAHGSRCGTSDGGRGDTHDRYTHRASDEFSRKMNRQGEKSFNRRLRGFAQIFLRMDFGAGGVLGWVWGRLLALDV